MKEKIVVFIIAIAFVFAAGVLFFSSCSTDSGKEQVNKKALNTAIITAGIVMDGILISADGTDLADTDEWVTEDAYSALEDALDAAIAVNANPNATQDQVDRALAALNTALAGFDPQPGKFVPANKTGLDAKIAEVETAMNGVRTSDNGSDIYPSDTWVTEAVYTALEQALANAKTVSENYRATQTETDSALSALDAAFRDFVPQEGTYVGTPVDKNALNDKIAAAETAIAGVKTSANGNDIPTNETWVTGAVYTALNNALTQAKAVSGEYLAMQAEVDSALTALTAALTNFVPKPGTFALSDSPVPAFSNVTVHDPSIFKSNDTSTDKFRIIGSFLASARTGDFIRWTVEQNGAGNNNYPTTMKYYPQDNPNASIQKVADQKADVLKASPNDGFNFFASDIHKMPNGKYYHYYSMTSTWKCSAIGVAIADTIDGNYITQGLFVRSAEAGNNKSPDGNQTWTANGSDVNPTNHPNCIDPQAFFDKGGNNFYLVYGSWSGGIFIYEIDTATGLPKAGSAMNAEHGGYGRQLISNRHSGIEAPYILYSPESDYYYLFVSYAGLASDGGYNMRVFRSRNPDGPYEDAKHPITSANPKPLTTKNLHPTAGNAMDFRNYGVKIQGGYQFAQETGENALNSNIGVDGFLSPGHNSAYYDSATGKYFLIHHTRFVGRGETHQVRVREMFVNEDGWLVAAPFRYDAGTIRSFSVKQLSSGGNSGWKILSHAQDNNTTVSGHTSQSYTFNENGTITGTGTGTWELKPDGKTAYITLDGKLYKGVFLRCYDEYHAVWVYAFTAMSSDGIALWGATRGVTTDLNVK